MDEELFGLPNDNDVSVEEVQEVQDLADETGMDLDESRNLAGNVSGTT